ncbi:hypothetical protein [Streptomyces sp. NPDC050988]|uniref:hypothetical protein n=1 Tax=Streptomyces sp. NPDC050988 TaxID=3365637 RepID=UPI0037B04EB6
MARDGGDQLLESVLVVDVRALVEEVDHQGAAGVAGAVQLGQDPCALQELVGEDLA